MPDSNCEIWRRIFGYFGSNILALCWSQNCSEWSYFCWGLRGASYGPISPNNDAIFQENSSPIHTASSVQSWFEKHEDALQNLTWPSHSPDLNIVRPLWSAIESRVRSRFPSATISQATISWSSWGVEHYSTRDHSELKWVYSKKVTSCIMDKCWPNSLLKKKCVSFTTFSTILFIPFIFSKWPNSLSFTSL